MRRLFKHELKDLSFNFKYFKSTQNDLHTVNNINNNDKKIMPAMKKILKGQEK